MATPPESRPEARLANSQSRARERLGYLLGKLASGEPAPASGSAAAAVLAVSAALLQKVAVRSDKWNGARSAHEKAEALRLRAEELIELDSIGFLEFLDATRSGRDAIGARDKTIDTPLEMARSGVAVVKLARDLESNGNQNLRADAVAAATLAAAAVNVAAMLVDVNIGPGAADPRRAEAQRLLRAVSASADRPAVRGRVDDSGRARGRSRDSDRPTRPRTSRGGPSERDGRRPGS